MKKRAITTAGVPAIGPYSAAVEAGPFVFISGQIPLVAETGQLIDGDIRAATEQAMENMATVLASAGLTMENVVKTTIYLADMADFLAVNDVYGRYFKADFPARATVQVAALPRGAKIEIDAVAFKVPCPMGS
ncbi:MAG TPA: reactive intermediate/imine deaminase [Syntrophus sp. (in: bacteria)]|nr:reactive intermediate/imine deaminase [Syntrophus sp. (in: bacteria)]